MTDENDPRRSPLDPSEGPQLAQADWDAVGGSKVDEDAAEVEAEAVYENGDIRYDALEQPDGDLPGEDDDNPYMESDEALPDEDDNVALRKITSDAASDDQ
jgi:hypothetical protein